MNEEPPKKRFLARQIASRLRAYRAASEKRRSEYLYLSGDKRWRRLMINLHPESLFSFFTSKDGVWFVFRIGVTLILIMSVLTTFAYFHYRREAPATILELQSCIEGRITEFYDRTGRELLWQLREGTDCQPVQLAEVSPYFIDGLISMEDKDFFDHPGYKITSIARSVINNLLGRPLQGGSTITQQYIKNAVLEDSDRSYERKIKEIVLVPEIENAYSKEEILAAYLNTIPFGSSYGGIEAASLGYLGKPAADLTLDESALLVASISAPNIFWNDPERHLQRRDLVLKVMLSDGKINEAEYTAAKAIDSLAKVRNVKKPALSKALQAPYFVLEARQQAEELICSRQSQCLDLEDGGYKIITSLSFSTQEQVEATIAATLEELAPTGYNNAALAVINSEDKEVLALAGGRGFDYPDFGQVNHITKQRQPGNLWQPLVYAALLETGDWGAGRIMYDYQTFDFEVAEDFRGPVSLRRSLAESLLTPAVKAAYLGGYTNLSQLTERLNLATLPACEDDCVFNQGGGVGFTTRLDSLANLYATFAAGGRYQDISYIRRIANSEGQTIYEHQSEVSEIFKPTTAYMINDILAENAFRPRGLRNYPDLAFRGIHTDNFRDNPFVAYTSATVVAGWVGEQLPADDSEQKNLEAATAAQSLLIKTFFETSSRPFGNWQRPTGLKLLPTNLTSGKIGSGPVDFYPEAFQPANLPTVSFKINTGTNRLANECSPKARLQTRTSSAFIPELADSDPAYEAWLRPILLNLGYRLDSSVPQKVDDC